MELAPDSAPPSGADGGAADAAVADGGPADAAVAEGGAADAPEPDAGPPADAAAADADPDAPAPTLYGAQVVFTSHCCTAPPTDANVIGPARQAEVDEDVEFPDISSSTAGADTIPADVDVQPSAIDIVYRTSAGSVGGAFNGYVLDFSGLVLPRIVGASFDVASTIDLHNGSVTFDDASASLIFPTPSW